jgi:hypothetical protein
MPFAFDYYFGTYAAPLFVGDFNFSSSLLGFIETFDKDWNYMTFYLSDAKTQC